MAKPMMLIAGPCVIESEASALHIAGEIHSVAQAFGLDFYFKASFDKANRSSIDSYRGPGMAEGLRILAVVKQRLGLRVVTDIHEPHQAAPVAEVADIIQIPAFLCRQTDLLTAAAKTGKRLNIKKAQFLAADDMANVVRKVEAAGNRDIMLCERGTTFGYHNLVVDMTSIPQMKALGYPVIFDATHSLQTPGSNGTSTGGRIEYALPLCRAALAAGAHGIFMETHPEPERALSDGPNMVRLSELRDFLSRVLPVYEAVNH